MNAKCRFYLVLLKHAFFIELCGGVCAVVCDFDHIPRYLELTNIVRPAHLFFGILAGAVACYCFARLGRLFVKSVLKNKRRGE